MILHDLHKNGNAIKCSHGKWSTFIFEAIAEKIEYIHRI